ncbi:MAG TPA: phosphodiester glycosidase family protein [Clostridiaceae bacterium]|nr:phosphodiester glycosidase family protein [Clostridiaceae bacterium]
MGTWGKTHFIKNGIIVTLLVFLLSVVIISFYKNGINQNEPATEKENNSTETTEIHETEEKINPIKYRRISEKIEGVKQEINILEIDLKHGLVEIFPVLSHDLIFGFEKLSSMALRHKAYAAVNGGFFYEYGEPAGMVIIHGELITNSTGKYPVFMTDGKKAELKELASRVWIEINGRKLYIDGINVEGGPGDIVIYTPYFGLTNRAEEKNKTAIVENGVVKEVVSTASETSIPKNGFLITMFDDLKDYVKDHIDIKIDIGENITFGIDPDLVENVQAYECGSWIVKDGNIVIGKTDEWIGVLTNRDPRTVLGLKDSHTVVLLTVDGRQPGYSAGFTAEELGRFLLSQGIKDAAMLDGGASTEMIIEGNIINKPSFKGEERPLCGGIVVRYLD